MYSTNDGRKFKNYKVNFDDIIYKAIREEDAEVFTNAINDEVDNIISQGFMVVGIAYRMEDTFFCAVIEYAHRDNIYYEEGVDEDDRTNGRSEQIQE